jgi:hypothetical protein
VVVEIISTPRLIRYGLGKDPVDVVLSRYKYNLALSEALYPTLSLLEVALRNQIDKALTQSSTADWLSEEWSGWVRTPGMKKKGLPNPEKESILKAKQSLFRNSGDWSYGKLIAELNFGFWVGMFKSYYHTSLWNKKSKPLTIAFPNSASLSPKAVYTTLDTIRQLRNRVAHHEPIFDSPKLYENHEKIMLVICWLGDDLAQYAKTIDRFPEVWEAFQNEKRLSQEDKLNDHPTF